jgi:hypothetical protein
MARAYPRWHGLEKITVYFGRKVPVSFRNCCICGQPATRVGTIQRTWFRSDDDTYPVCGPSNACRDALKKREGVAERFPVSPSAQASTKEHP